MLSFSFRLMKKRKYFDKLNENFIRKFTIYKLFLTTTSIVDPTRENYFIFFHFYFHFLFCNFVYDIVFQLKFLYLFLSLKSKSKMTFCSYKTNVAREKMKDKKNSNKNKINYKQPSHQYISIEKFYF